MVETDWPRGVFLLFNCAPTLPHGSHQLLLAKEKAPNAETVGAKRWYLDRRSNEQRKLAHYSVLSIYSAPTSNNAEDSYRC